MMIIKKKKILRKKIEANLTIFHNKVKATKYVKSNKKNKSFLSQTIL